MSLADHDAGYRPWWRTRSATRSEVRTASPRIAAHVGRRFPVASSHLDLGFGVGTMPLTADLRTREVSRWGPWYGATIGFVLPGARSSFQVEVGRIRFEQRDDGEVWEIPGTLARFRFAWVVF